MIHCKKPTHQLEVMPDHIRVMFISWDFYPLESANMIIL